MRGVGSEHRGCETGDARDGEGRASERPHASHSESTALQVVHDQDALVRVQAHGGVTAPRRVTAFVDIRV